VERFFDDISDAYENGIQAPGKELHFLILVAFLCSFGFIRGSAHMIRAQVSWWPGNVETKGGTHIHHLVWGILLLLVAGYLGIALEPGSPWREIFAALFGIGMGLTLDEFALWLNLEDVYWQEKGRQSIDAVIVAATLLAIAALGVGFFVDLADAALVLVGIGGERLSPSESRAVLIPIQALGVVAAATCFLKGKTLTAIVGVFVPPVAAVGSLRLAKPGSRWSRHYPERKLERARARFGEDAVPTAAG